MRQAAFAILILLICFSICCSSGSAGLVVRAIDGPSQVDEGETAVYTVTASGDTGISYEWALDPSTAGLLSGAGTNSASFTTAMVDSDTTIRIRVSVSSADYGPVVASIIVTVIDVIQDDDPSDGVNQPPEAQAQPEDAEILLGDTVFFFDNSFDPDGSMDIISREWDFSYEEDDGFNIDSTDGVAEWEYHDPGLYQVQLRVTDTEGLEDILDEPLTIRVHGLTYVRTWGGALADSGYGLDVDQYGHVYVTGQAHYDTDFDPGPAFERHNLNRSAFLSRFNVDGSLDWSISWGPVFGFGDATEYCNGYDVAVNDAGMIGVCGHYQADPLNSGAIDFDPGADEIIDRTAYQSSFTSFFNSNGDFISTKLVKGSYSSGYYGSHEYYMDRRIACSEPGDFYTLAYEDLEDDLNDAVQGFSSDGLPTWRYVWEPLGDYESGGDLVLTSSLNICAVSNQWSPDKEGIVCLDPDGELLWGVNYIDYVSMKAIDIDNQDNFYVTGDYLDPDQWDGDPYRPFLARFNPDGELVSEVRWTSVGSATDIALDAYGNIYLTGTFGERADFDPGEGVFEVTPESHDIYLLKLDNQAEFEWVRTWGDDDVVNPDPTRLAIDDVNEYVYILGSFYGTIDFNPGPGVQAHTSIGQSDVFLLRFNLDGF